MKLVIVFMCVNAFLFSQNDLYTSIIFKKSDKIDVEIQFPKFKDNFNLNQLINILQDLSDRMLTFFSDIGT